MLRNKLPEGASTNTWGGGLAGKNRVALASPHLGCPACDYHVVNPKMLGDPV